MGRSRSAPHYDREAPRRFPTSAAQPPGLPSRTARLGGFAPCPRCGAPPNTRRSTHASTWRRCQDHRSTSKIIHRHRKRGASNAKQANAATTGHQGSEKTQTTTPGTLEQEKSHLVDHSEKPNTKDRARFARREGPFSDAPAARRVCSVSAKSAHPG